MEESDDLELRSYGRSFVPIGVGRTMPARYDSSLPRWYPFLTRSRGEFRQALFEKEPFKDNVNLAVCLQAQVRDREHGGSKPNTVRMFTVFETPEHFFAWMSHDVPAPLRCAYEIVRETARQKPYFDIDLSVSKIPKGTTISDIEASVVAIARVASNVADVSSAQALIFSSSSETKYSFHIVINGVFLPSNAAAQMYCRTVLSEVSRDSSIGEQVMQCVIDAVDTKVYSKLQQFRILGNRKVGENDCRVKTYRPDLSEWHPAIGTLQSDFKTLCASLVTCFSSTCAQPSAQSMYSKFVEAESISRLALEDSKARRSTVFGYSENTELSLSEAKDMLDLAKSKLETLGAKSPFEVRDSGDTVFRGSVEEGILIPLNRLAPSFCPLCARTHEKEHPFLIVFPGSSVIIKCRRGTGAMAKVELQQHSKVQLTEGALVKHLIASSTQSHSRASRDGSFQSDETMTPTTTTLTRRTLATSQSSGEKSVGKVKTGPVFPPAVGKMGVLFGAPKKTTHVSVHGVTKEAAYGLRGVSDDLFALHMAKMKTLV